MTQADGGVEDRSLLERYRLMVAAARDGVHVLDTAGRLLEANARFCDMLGYTASELVGQHVSAWDETWRGAELDRQIAAVAANGALFTTRHRRKDGVVIDVEIQATVFEWDGGRQLVCTSRDISGRVATESALRESEARFRTMFERHAAVMLLIETETGAIRDANAAAARFYGYGVEQLRRMYIDQINTLSPTRVLEERRRAAEERRNFFVFEHRLASGQVRTVEVHSSPIVVGLERILFSIVHDITDRVAAEAELRIAATAFETEEGIIVTDAAGFIARVNRAFTRLTGYTPDEVVGRKPSLLASGLHDRAFYAAMWRDIAEHHYWQGEIRNRRKSGEHYVEWLTISAVLDPRGVVTHYVGVFSDISRQKEAERAIRDLAFYDSLTGLANRRLLADRLRQSLASHARQQHHGALLFIDLDNFKHLNDTLGHAVGDRLLVAVAERLRAGLRAEDTVARWGGDEFVVVLEELGRELRVAAHKAELVSAKLAAALHAPFQLAGYEHVCTASIGIAIFRGADLGLEELLKRADFAMYQAKQSGRNAIRFFDPAMQAALEQRVLLERQLRRAIERHQFRLVYQPQFDADGHFVGAEALLRWDHPEHGVVSPEHFFAVAEETGLIVPIGHVVLEGACATLARWARGPRTRHAELAINVSARQFRQPDFADGVRRTLAATGADPRRLRLEVTETLALADLDETVARIRELGELGVRFAMDDFGTGYSSLAQLATIPLDQLKIDRSFVAKLDSGDAKNATIVQTIIGMAANLGLTTVAEGVETVTQHEFLRRHGCRWFQGFLFGPPRPIEELDELLENLPA